MNESQIKAHNDRVRTVRHNLMKARNVIDQMHTLSHSLDMEYRNPLIEAWIDDVFDLVNHAYIASDIYWDIERYGEKTEESSEIT